MAPEVPTTVRHQGSRLVRPGRGRSEDRRIRHAGHQAPQVPAIEAGRRLSAADSQPRSLGTAAPMALSLKAHHLARYKDIAALLVKHGRSTGLRDFDPEDPADRTTPRPRRTPSKLVDDLESMGPTFVKLGQLLSTRADLLPPVYLEALARLQDDVEPVAVRGDRGDRHRRDRRPDLEGLPVLRLHARWPAPRSVRCTGPCCATAGRWRSRCSGPASASRSSTTWRSSRSWPSSSTTTPRSGGATASRHGRGVPPVDHGRARLPAGGGQPPPPRRATSPATTASSCPSRSTTTPRRSCSPWTASTAATSARSARWPSMEIDGRALAQRAVRRLPRPDPRRTASSTPTPTRATCCSPSDGRLALIDLGMVARDRARDAGRRWCGCSSR